MIIRSLNGKISALMYKDKGGTSDEYTKIMKSINGEKGRGIVKLIEMLHTGLMMNKEANRVRQSNISILMQQNISIMRITQNVLDQ